MLRQALTFLNIHASEVLIGCRTRVTSWRPELGSAPCRVALARGGSLTSPSRVRPAQCPATALLGPALGCPRPTHLDPPRPPLGGRVNRKETSPPECALPPRLARESLSLGWATAISGCPPMIPSSDPRRKSLHQRDRRWRWVGEGDLAGNVCRRSSRRDGYPNLAKAPTSHQLGVDGAAQEEHGESIPSLAKPKFSSGPLGSQKATPKRRLSV